MFSAERQEEDKVSACIWQGLKGHVFLGEAGIKIQCFLQERQKKRARVFCREAGREQSFCMH